jgi:hypothetical protein
VGKQFEPRDEKAINQLAHKCPSGLTYSQQLKQDAVLWAEFLYAEYKREKAQLEDTQIMDTSYGKSDA